MPSRNLQFTTCTWYNLLLKAPTIFLCPYPNSKRGSFNQKSMSYDDRMTYGVRGGEGDSHRRRPPPRPPEKHSLLQKPIPSPEKRSPPPEKQDTNDTHTPTDRTLASRVCGEEKEMKWNEEAFWWRSGRKVCGWGEKMSKNGEVGEGGRRIRRKKERNPKF